MDHRWAAVMNEQKQDLDQSYGLLEDDGRKMDDIIVDGGETPGFNDPGIASLTKPKRTSLACIRCRSRHIKCPGGDPCKKCQLAKTKCEYVEADKKIVVSMKYLTKLHDDIARLKKDNATLRNNLKKEELKQGVNATNAPHVPMVATTSSSPPQSHTRTQSGPFGGGRGYSFLMDHEFQSLDSKGGGPSMHPNSVPLTFNANEVIGPSLGKQGRLVQSRTGEKLFVGPSSMTLFGLEIQNMVPQFNNSLGMLEVENKDSPQDSPVSQTASIHESVGSVDPKVHKRETEVLAKEGNAYKITLAKTNTRPGLSINFTLPSYSYAMLLVDTFVNYNDGCFYFFNEGLVKKFLMNLYSGKSEDNKKILKRNSTSNFGPVVDENSIKKDADDDTILETIWFCIIMLIFATGEMYLGTESDIHIKKLREKMYGLKVKKKDGTSKSTTKDPKRNTLPGSSFFYEASELFTGLFASGAIDNITKDGGIEAMLLYAFYLQTADCTIASYFYFGLALRASLILGWHVDAGKDNVNRYELEHRRRIWWTVYMYERMLSSKAGLPLSFADDSVSTELPSDIETNPDNFSRDENDVRSLYIFPPHEYIKNCVTITQTNAIILSSLYTRQPTVNILPVVADLVHRLITWKADLPDFLKVDFSAENIRISRLVVNLMTEYFQGVNLAVRPLLFHFATKKLKEFHQHNNINRFVDLTKYSRNVLSLLNSSFQASINTIKAIWGLMPDNMVALFGWMDREYLFTSACTLILFNASFGVYDATKEHLDHALVIFRNMKKLGNYPAALRRAQLLKLIGVLDFNGVMIDLLSKHDDEAYHRMHKEDNTSKTMFDNNQNYDISSIFSHDGLAAKKNQESGVRQRPDQELPDLPYRGNNPGVDEFLSFGPGSTVKMNEDDDIQVPNPTELFPSNGNVLDETYLNTYLAGIEGLTYMDDEQKLWNEITTDAVWLNVNSGQPPLSTSLFESNKSNTPDANDGLARASGKPFGSGTKLNKQGGGNYSDLISEEFQSSMVE